MKNMKKTGLLILSMVFLLAGSKSLMAAELTPGIAITVSESGGGEFSNTGSFIFTLDAVHINKSVSGYIDKGVKALAILCVVENIDYEIWYDASASLTPYDVSEYVRVKDSDGFSCEFYYLDDSSGDGKYSIGEEIRRGEKVREALIYLVDQDMDEFTIDVEGYTCHCVIDESGNGILDTAGGEGVSSQAADPKETSPGVSSGSVSDAGSMGSDRTGDGGTGTKGTESAETLEDLKERVAALERDIQELKELVKELGHGASGPENGSGESRQYSAATAHKYDIALTGYYKLRNSVKKPGSLVIYGVKYSPSEEEVIFQYGEELDGEMRTGYASFRYGAASIETYGAERAYNSESGTLDMEEAFRYNEEYGE